MLKYYKQLPKRNDVFDFVLNRPMKHPERVESILVDAATGEADGVKSKEVVFHPLSVASVADLEYLKEKHASTAGIVIAFTTEWCPFGGALRSAYLKAVGRMSSQTVLAAYEIESESEMDTIRAKFGLDHFPAIAFFADSKSSKPTAVYNASKLRSDVIIAFIQEQVNLLDRSDDISFPVYRRATTAEVRSLDDNTMAMKIAERGKKPVSTATELAPVRLGTAEVTFFTSSWCGKPCEQVDETSSLLQTMLRGSDAEVKTFKMTKSTMKEMKEKYDVRSVPTVLIRCGREQGDVSNESPEKEQVTCTPTMKHCATPAAIAHFVEMTCFEVYTPPAISEEEIARARAEAERFDKETEARLAKEAAKEAAKGKKEGDDDDDDDEEEEESNSANAAAGDDETEEFEGPIPTQAKEEVLGSTKETPSSAAADDEGEF